MSARPTAQTYRRITPGLTQEGHGIARFYYRSWQSACGRSSQANMTEPRLTERRCSRSRYAGLGAMTLARKRRRRRSAGRAAARLVGSPRARQGDADQQPAQSVRDRAELRDAARRPQMGIGQRDPRRSRRQTHLGRRSLRHQFVRRIRRSTRSSSSIPAARSCELRRRVRSSGPTAWTSTSRATSGSPMRARRRRPK